MSDLHRLSGYWSQIDDRGNCYTHRGEGAANDPIVGIWYRDRSGSLVDNYRAGSEPWTRESSDRLLKAAGR